MTEKYRIAGSQGRREVKLEPGDLVWLHLRNIYIHTHTYIYYWSAYIYNTYILINRNLIHTHIYIYIGILFLIIYIRVYYHI